MADSKKTGHGYIKTGTALLLKYIIHYIDKVKTYVMVASEFYYYYII